MIQFQNIFLVISMIVSSIKPKIIRNSCLIKSKRLFRLYDIEKNAVFKDLKN